MDAKKGKTERIPLSKAAITILTRIAKTRSPYVFPGRGGGQRKNFQRIARRVKGNAGLPADFRPLHGLRHSLTCLECGKVFKIISARHLASHGLNAIEYKAKWGLKDKPSLLAKSVLRERRKRVKALKPWEKQKKA